MWLLNGSSGKEEIRRGSEASEGERKVCLGEGE